MPGAAADLDAAFDFKFHNGYAVHYDRPQTRPPQSGRVHAGSVGQVGGFWKRVWLAEVVDASSTEQECDLKILYLC